MILKFRTVHPLVSEEGRKVYVAEVKLCHSGAIDDPGASHQMGWF